MSSSNSIVLARSPLHDEPLILQTTFENLCQDFANANGRNPDLTEKITIEHEARRIHHLDPVPTRPATPNDEPNVGSLIPFIETMQISTPSPTPSPEPTKAPKPIDLTVVPQLDAWLPLPRPARPLTLAQLRLDMENWNKTREVATAQMPSGLPSEVQADLQMWWTVEQLKEGAEEGARALQGAVERLEPLSKRIEERLSTRMKEIREEVEGFERVECTSEGPTQMRGAMNTLDRYCGWCDEAELDAPRHRIWARDLVEEGDLTYDLCQSCFDKAAFMTHYEYRPIYAYQPAFERVADTYPTVKTVKAASAYVAWEKSANQWLEY